MINSEREDLAQRVREITGGSGVDAAVDPIGGETTGQVQGCERPRFWNRMSGARAGVGFWR